MLINIAIMFRDCNIVIIIIVHVVVRYHYYIVLTISFPSQNKENGVCWIL